MRGGPVQDVRWPVESDKRHGGDQEESGEHDEPLHDVGVGDREETADEGVGDGDGCNDNPPGEVVAAEGRLEVAPARDDAGRDIKGEKHDDDGRRDDPYRPRSIGQAVLKEARQRDRIVRGFRVTAKLRRHDGPGDEAAGEKTHSNPQFGQPRDEQRAGQAHEQPAGHIRCAGRKGRDEWV